MSFVNERTNSLLESIRSTKYAEAGCSISQDDMLIKVIDLFNQCKKNQKKVFVIGNGGSCAIASHHAVDLINVAKLSAIALSDSSLATCMGNDFGYEHVYSRPLQTLIGENDLLIAISSSGTSQNILNAAKVCKEKKGILMTLSGFLDSNPLRAMGDLSIWTGISDYGIVESAHFFILHTFVDAMNANCHSKVYVNAQNDI